MQINETNLRKRMNLFDSTSLKIDSIIIMDIFFLRHIAPVVIIVIFLKSLGIINF